MRKPSQIAPAAIIPRFEFQGDGQGPSAGSRCGFDDGQELNRSFTEACGIDEFGGVLSLDAPEVAVRGLEQYGWTLSSITCSELAAKYGRAGIEAGGRMWVACLA